MQADHPYCKLLTAIELEGKPYRYFDLNKLQDKRLAQLPLSIKILLECAIRNCDDFNVKKEHVEAILDWKNTSASHKTQIPFKPSRVILQDLTGVPLVVDLAAMRDAMKRLGGDPSKVNPLCPVDLVIDHSVQVDFARTQESLLQNEQRQFQRNRERFQFLKWGQSTFNNFSIVPPGFGIVHQVNLEHLASVVFDKEGLLYPDSVVGTDSHTTMINGLGVLGWGVGGIQAQAVMLGQCTAMVLPEVIGFRFTSQLKKTATATDLVLLCTKMLREKGVVDKFVEFHGPGVKSLSLADRATLSNMAPEYGATVGMFGIDERTINYLEQTGRDKQKIEIVKAYLQGNNLFMNYDAEVNPAYSSVIELDLSTVEPCLSGPKRPHDYVRLSDMKTDWSACLNSPVGFKGFGLKGDSLQASANINLNGKEFNIKHGSVVIAAITSCTNTSNPGVMLAAALICKNAVERGVKVAPFIKTSLSPGSQVVSKYFDICGLTKYLNEMGFYHAGYGCMTCIGNSGDINPDVEEVVKEKGICVVSVLSGNRNFEGRVHPLTKANYLASPPLVVAYAIAGTVDIDFEKEPVAIDQEGKEVYLKDLWPSKAEIQKLQLELIQPQIYRQTYSKISKGTERWNALKTADGVLFPWDQNSTYIHDPPFFKHVQRQLPPLDPIRNAFILAVFGDSITTDHISPAGNISITSPAARFLKQRGIEKKDFNTYGSRRGNDLIMARGTFANIRILNKMAGKEGPFTVHVPSDQVLPIFDASAKYLAEGQQLVVFGGKEYGSGSSRDWAAKGPYLLGVKAVIAESYQRIHRSNLIGMGILPLLFQEGESVQKLGITGKETVSLDFNPTEATMNQTIAITLTQKDGAQRSFSVVSSLKTEVQLTYFRQGGVLPFVLRKETK